MVKRYWEITCDYCGRILGRNEYYRPRPDECTDIAFVQGKHVFCNANCAAEFEHNKTIQRAGNLKQFQPGKSSIRK